MKNNNRQVTVTFLLLTLIFCVCLITANLLEFKVFTIGQLTLTAGLIVFPVSYIINDCIVEIYGFAKARLAIWIGFAANLFVSIMLQIGILLPNGISSQNQEAMEMVFGTVPRIFAASFIAFICGSMVNAYVMSRMKSHAAKSGSQNSSKGFSIRAIASTIFGEGVDSLIFFPIAFAGILPWETIAGLIATQTLLKTAYEIVVLPLTLLIVARLRTIDGSEISGSQTYNPEPATYKWWRINDF